jgi:hypothetical protein
MNNKDKIGSASGFGSESRRWSVVAVRILSSDKKQKQAVSRMQ